MDPLSVLSQVLPEGLYKFWMIGFVHLGSPLAMSHPHVIPSMTKAA